MPAYEYENKRHGLRVTVNAPVQTRPGRIVLTRRTVPSVIRVNTGVKEATLSQKIHEGYRQLEARGHLAKKAPASPSTKEIKRILSQ